MKGAFVLAFVVFASASAFASISMVYPSPTLIEDASVVQLGSVEPGQVFEAVFSDNTGFQNTEWDTLVVDPQTLSLGWTVDSIGKTDTSLVVRVGVPLNAQSNVYNLGLDFYSSHEPVLQQSFVMRVVVKQPLISAAFSKKSVESITVVDSPVVYAVSLSNSSIAKQEVVVSSNLPQNWFAAQRIVLEPNSSKDLELVVTPKVYGQRTFSFKAVIPEKSLVVKSFTSELNVKPTLKGKFGSAFSGFPFFNFALLPFQLFDSFLAFAMPN